MKVPVEVLSKPQCEVFVITATLTDGTRSYDLHCADVLVARATDPRALSQYAFAHGAVSVRWDFDLNLCERSARYAP